MSASCQPAARDRVRRAARDLESLPCVVGANVLEPSTDSSDAWGLDATVETARAGGVPAVVSRTLADHDLEILLVDPQGFDEHDLLAIA